MNYLLKYNLSLIRNICKGNFVFSPEGPIYHVVLVNLQVFFETLLFKKKKKKIKNRILLQCFSIPFTTTSSCASQDFFRWSQSTNNTMKPT